MRHGLFVAIVLGCLAPTAARGDSYAPWPTYRQLLQDSEAVLLVQVDADPKDIWNRQRKLIVLEALKDHATLKGVKAVHLNYGIRLIGNPPRPKQMIAFGVRHREIWDWHHAADASSDALRCIKGLLKIDLKNDEQVLRYNFDFLKSAEEGVARQAYDEWTRAKDAVVARVAKKLPPAEVRALVLNPDVSETINCYASFLLGHCGGTQDAALVRQAFESAAKPYAAQGDLTDVLKGYVLLKPKEGWALLTTLMKNDRKENSLRIRLMCLRVARYFFADHPNVVPKQNIQILLAELLDQPDMADLAVDDFRKWKSWDYTDRILALFARKSYDISIVQRAILRYALQCPDPACARFVTEQRRRDREWVEDVEEGLKLDTAP